MIKGEGRQPSISFRIVVKVHGSGPLKGKPKLWYWACAVCGLTYMVKRWASCCCYEKKDRHWIRHIPDLNLRVIGRTVDGKFERSK